MKIEVINHTLSTIEIAINQWGSGAETGFFKIPSDGKESWGRNSDKGYIMIVNNAGEHDGTWYVKKGAVIKFHENGDCTTKGVAFKIYR